MNRIKYLLIFCIVIILTAITIQSLSQNISETLNQQAQEIVPVGVVSSDSKTSDNIDQSILIDDHDKPIIVKPTSKVIVSKPYITAESYLVANLDTGEVYLSLNPNKVVPIASVSKLYTALVVHHLFDLSSQITITQSMLDAYGDAGNLMLNEKFLPNELLNFLLMVSSNDAAEAFAQSFGYDKFMEQMNGFAEEIGMHHTFFRDSSGLSPQNVSNAQDLFVLSRYLYKSEKDILNISKTHMFDFATTTDHGSHHLVNIDPFSLRASFIGGKTGRTDEAKEAMVSMFEQEVDNVTYPIAVIVLRSDFGQREINTERLLTMFMEKVKK